MAEKELRKYLASKLDGHTMQIESHATAVGVPDTNTYGNGRENWIELKFTRGNRKFKMRPGQLSWFKRRGRAGAANLWLFWRHESEDGQKTHGLIHMVGDTPESVFRDTTVRSWRGLSVATWGREVDGELLNTLLGEHYE